VVAEAARIRPPDRPDTGEPARVTWSRTHSRPTVRLNGENSPAAGECEDHRLESWTVWVGLEEADEFPPPAPVQQPRGVVVAHEQGRPLFRTVVQQFVVEPMGVATPLVGTTHEEFPNREGPVSGLADHVGVRDLGAGPPARVGRERVAERIADQDVCDPRGDEVESRQGEIAVETLGEPGSLIERLIGDIRAGVEMDVNEFVAYRPRLICAMADDDGRRRCRHDGNPNGTPVSGEAARTSWSAVTCGR
jgi:hypothetical protein